jgi:hypothetical protein
MPDFKVRRNLLIVRIFCVVKNILETLIKSSTYLVISVERKNLYQLGIHDLFGTELAMTI